MNDSIPFEKNKFFLFFNLGVGALAVIALIFTVRTHSETKAANDIIRIQADKIEVMSGDLRRAQDFFAKSNDVRTIQGSVDELKQEVADFKREVAERLTDVNKGFHDQSLINRELSIGRAAAPAADAGISHTGE